MHWPPPTSIHLDPVPPSSIHLDPVLPSSIHLHLAHFSLHPALCKNLNVIRTKTSHVIGQFSPNLNQKTQSCPFRLKIGRNGIFEVLIRNPNLNFWSYVSKIHFWANLSQKNQVVRFPWKLAHIAKKVCKSR